MKLYVIRHGESVTNLANQWTGWADVPLTEKGIQDARRAGEILKGISFDKIYSSDLIRARKTAETALPGCEYQTSPLLREIDVGSLEYAPVSTLTQEQRARIATHGAQEFGGETREAFRARIDAFVEQLESLECERVAVFTHAGWLRSLLSKLLEVQIPGKKIRCGNCTVGIFEYRGGQWQLCSWISDT